MAISTNGTVLARVAGALYNTQMSNATYNEVKTLDPASLTDALYARDFSASTDAAVATTLVTNLGLTSVTGLNNWVAAQLTAAGSHKGAKIVDLLNSFAQMTADTTYGTYATAFNTKVDAALVLSQTTGNAGGTFAAAGTPVVTNGTFALTAGVDTFVGGAGNDTFTGNTATNSASTLTSLDSIDGGDGNDTLNITVAGAAVTQTSTGYTVKNIETANLSSDAAVTATTSAWTGLTTLNAIAGDDVVITAAATTNVAVVASDLSSDGTSAAELSVNGGNNVSTTSADSVTLTAGPATSGQIVIGGTTAPKGTVVVTHTETGVDASGDKDATGSTIAITGGSVVTVNSYVKVGASDDAGDTMTVGAISVTGTADTTSVTVNQTAAAARSATAIAIINGGVTIADVNAAEATKAGSIASVSLSSYGDSTVDSSALTSVTLAGKGGTFGIGRGALTATPTANTLALNTNALTGGNITDSEASSDDGFTTINLTNTGTTVVADLITADLTTLNISGSGSLTLTANTLGGALTTSIVSTSTGSVKLGGALTAAANYSGADGVDTVTAGSGATGTISTGAGNDVITVSTLGTAGRINGGDGVDTLAMTPANAATASASGTFSAKVTSVEKLALDAYSDATAVTVNLVNLNNINYVTSAGATASTGGARAQAISGFSTGATFAQTALLGTDQNVTLSGAGFASSTADTFNITLDGADGWINAGSLTLADVETIAITTNDNDTTAATAAFDPNIDITSVKSLTVSGNAGITFANSDLGTALTSFNASGVTVGSVTYTTGVLTSGATLTGGAGADTLSAASSTATAGVTINGGAGNDTITGSATKASTLNGEAGNDTITGGSAADTVDGGTGTNTFVFSSANIVEQAGSGTTTGVVINLSDAALTYSAVYTASGAYLAGTQASVASGSSTYLFNNESSTNSSVVDTLANIQNVTGTNLADYIVGSSAANTITGGTGADILTGGAGVDTFVFASGDSTPTIGGAGNSGTVSAYDTVTDFTLGTSSLAGEKLDVAGTGAKATAATVGTDSVLTVGGAVLTSATIASTGMSTFTITGGATLTIDSAAKLAAAVEILTLNDIGAAGDTTAFTGTIGGVAHTWVYTQTGAGAGGDLVDLVGVTATALSATNAATASLLYIA